MNVGIYGGGVPFARFESGRIPPGLSHRSTANGVEFSGVPTQAGRYVSYWTGPYPDPTLYRPYTYICASERMYLGSLGFKCNYSVCHEGVGHVVVRQEGAVVFDGHPTTGTMIPFFGARTDSFSATVVYDGGGHCCDRAEFTTWKMNRGWGTYSEPDEEGKLTDPWNNGYQPNGGNLYWPGANASLEPVYRLEGPNPNTAHAGLCTVIGTHNLDNLSTCDHVDGGGASWTFDVPSEEQMPSSSANCPTFACPLFRHVRSGNIVEFCPATRFAIVIVVGSGGIQDPLPDSSVNFSETHPLSLTPVTWGKTFRALREVPTARGRRSGWATNRNLYLDYQQTGTGRDVAHFEDPVLANQNAGIVLQANAVSNTLSVVRTLQGGSLETSPTSPQDLVNAPLVGDLAFLNDTSRKAAVMNLQEGATLRIKNIPVAANKSYMVQFAQYLPTFFSSQQYDQSAWNAQSVMKIGLQTTLNSAINSFFTVGSLGSAGFQFGGLSLGHIGGGSFGSSHFAYVTSHLHILSPWIVYHQLYFGPIPSGQSYIAIQLQAPTGMPEGSDFLVGYFNIFETNGGASSGIWSPQPYTGAVPPAAPRTHVTSLPLFSQPIFVQPDLGGDVNSITHSTESTIGTGDGWLKTNSWDGGSSATATPRISQTEDLPAIDMIASDWNVTGSSPSSEQTPALTLLTAGQRIFNIPLTTPMIDGSTRQSAINHTFRIQPSGRYKLFTTSFYSLPLQLSDFRILALEDGLASTDLPARIRLRRYPDISPEEFVTELNRNPSPGQYDEASWVSLYGIENNAPAPNGYGAVMPYKRILAGAEDRSYFLGILVPPRTAPTSITISATLKVIPL